MFLHRYVVVKTFQIKTQIFLFYSGAVIENAENRKSFTKKKRI